MRTGYANRAVYHAAGRDGTPVAINKMAEGPFPEHYEPIETRWALTRCIRTWCLTRLFVCMTRRAADG